MVVEREKMENGGRTTVLEFIGERRKTGATRVSVYSISTRTGIPVSTVDRIFDELIDEGVELGIEIEGLKGDIKNE